MKNHWKQQFFCELIANQQKDAWANFGYVSIFNETDEQMLEPWVKYSVDLGAWVMLEPQGDHY